ncbi:FKBP-type peptidyl-prolyl cis-trans isomerase [Mobilicoccus pelagius]|uniref:peptidylprolyl isomerase n=1 Tax=Mobilicoccus pelagius NBRC 104925 TaxID=1089455 RepID=H5UTF7_9MICO|nr:FKBP-type peptidyl-prolyl cis-trans isomerase [Mobilicoccus pelagius]GAB49015.1 peptidyl-prolyl cis-trans isomerase FKBP-type [Mobilicoccus pelagius NBRC 104925]
MSSIRLRLAATVLPVALALTACGDKPDDTSAQAPAPTTASAPAQSAELAGIKVEGAGTEKPRLVLPSTPFTTSGRGFRVLKEGSGTQIGGQDDVSAHYLLVNGKDGKQLDARFGKEVVGMSLSDETLQQAIRTAMVGQKAGAQIVVAIPGKEAVGEQGNSQLGVGPTDTLLYYFEVVDAKTPLTKATGTPVPPKAGLPTVTMGKTAKDPATFAIPKGATPPKETVVQPLIVGKGPKVEPRQTVRVTYTGATWREPGKPFDHSGQSPQGFVEFPVGEGQLIKGWDKGLPGHPVGSRLLVVVPPKDGYGAQGKGEAIKGTDTLVFVLDILDAK